MRRLAKALVLIMLVTLASFGCETAGPAGGELTVTISTTGSNLPSGYWLTYFSNGGSSGDATVNINSTTPFFVISAENGAEAYAVELNMIDAAGIVAAQFPNCTVTNGATGAELQPPNFPLGGLVVPSDGSVEASFVVVCT